MPENVFHAEDRFRSPLLLPEEFWQARPILTHIRQAARKRQAPPDLTLGAVLARIAVLADPRLRIPPTRGYCSPMGLFVCGTAGSSGGKTTSMSVARELLPYHFEDCVLDAMPATGEAMLELFWDEDEDEDGKPQRRRTASSALISIDEGTLLQKLDGRSGNTLLPFLLTAWSGTTVGTDTIGSVGRKGVKRRLAGGTYVLSAVVALQPKKAAHLVAQGDSGFAQRFLWFSDKDPGLPREEPDDHRIIPLQFQRLWAGMDREIAGHNGLREVRCTDAIRKQIWDEGWQQRQFGYSDGDGLAGHDLLNQRRVAHLLGLLEGRLDIDDEDWELARQVSATSAANREMVVGVQQQQKAGERIAYVNLEVERAIAVATAKDTRLRLLCRDSVLRCIEQHAPRPKIHRACVSGDQRPFIPDALDVHEGNGLIRWHPGDSVTAVGWVPA